MRLCSIRLLPICGIFITATLFLACKTTKEAPTKSYDLLYQSWEMDSIRVTGKEIPFAHMNKLTIEFTREGEIISTVKNKIERIAFILKDGAIIDKNNPEEPPQIIEKLTEESLILLTKSKDAAESRLYLSAKSENP